MKKTNLWPILTGLSLILSACLPNLPVPQAATAPPSSPSPQPTATHTSAPIPTAAVPDPAGLFGGLPLDAYEGAILSFLNAGGQPTELVAPLSGPDEQLTGHRAWIGDGNGDGRPDMAAGLIQPDEAALLPPGSLLVFLSDQEGAYYRAYEWTTEPGQAAPQVEFFQDLDADGQAEIVASARTCGAHTCFLDLRLLDWDGASLRDVTPASTSELPEPQLSITEGEADGRFDVVLVPSGIGSAGAGPYRGENQRWVITDGAWMAQSQPQPPQYLIHAIHEGDDLLASGRLAEAREWYTAVVNQDPSLQTSGLVEDEVTLLASFATFRLVQIALLSGDTLSADQLIQSAENSSIGSGIGTPYVVLAQLYRQAFNGNNMAAACEVILGFINGRESDILTPLGSQVFGYANRDYLAEDLCPQAP